MLKSTAHTHIHVRQRANECVLDTDIVSCVHFQPLQLHMCERVCVSAHFFSVNLDTSICGLHLNAYSHSTQMRCISYIVVYIWLSLPILVFVFVTVLLAWFQFRRRINTNIRQNHLHRRWRWNCSIECAFCASVDLVIHSFFVAFHCMPLLFVMVILLLSFFLKHNLLHTH